MQIMVYLIPYSPAVFSSVSTMITAKPTFPVENLGCKISPKASKKRSRYYYGYAYKIENKRCR